MNFDYTVIRSKRKTVGIQVKPSGEVIVRAPIRAPEGAIAAIVENHRAWIEKSLEDCRRRREAHPEPTEQQIARLRALAEQIIPARVEYFSRLTGLYPTSVKITAAKTRFGSCSAKNGVCFSLYLMQYPASAVDYVVLHELAHIRHHNHSAAFYALIDRYMPDHKSRRALLRG